MDRGTRAFVMYEAEMPKEGMGRLYLLSNGLVFDARGKGVRFEAHFDSIVKFWAVRPDKFFVTIRKRWGRKTFVFKIGSRRNCQSPSGIEMDLEYMMAEYAHNLTLRGKSRRNGLWNRNKINFDTFCRTEAAWLECNWSRMLPYVKEQGRRYLNEYVHTVRVGSPYVNPYLLIVEYENLSYDDFQNLPGFLGWRYGDMTDAELEMAVSVFRDYRQLTISAFELEVERQSRSRNYQRHNHSLFEHVAIALRRIEEDRMAKERQDPNPPKVMLENLHELVPMHYNCNLEDTTI